MLGVSCVCLTRSDRGAIVLQYKIKCTYMSLSLLVASLLSCKGAMLRPSHVPLSNQT